MSNIITANQLKKAFSSAYANLENNKQIVNNLNVFPVPDGDTGTNMALTMLFAVKEIEKQSFATCDDVTSACANGALMGARGNSGVILSQLIRGLSKGVSGKDALTIADLVGAFEAAKEMAYKAVMKPTEGTILTVAREMSEFASAHYQDYASLESFFGDVIKHGRISLDNTPNLLPVLKEAGVVDSGGKGLLCLMEGAYASIKGEDIVLQNKAEDTSAPAEQSKGEISSDIEFQYCTEFLITAKDTKKDYQKFLIEKLVKLGDSLLVVGDEKIIKVHVHTNEPWTAMKYAASCGDLMKIKIENMKEQAQDAFGILTDEDVKKASGAPAKTYDTTPVKYCVVSVCAGAGFAAILKDLGVAYLVEGGQTMNPSTQDFLDVIENTNAEHYILMPNNKNIIMAADQAKAMSDKDVRVLPTKTIPQAITAMLNYDPDADCDEMFALMQESITAVKTGQLTFAVRDTSVDEITIEKGDIIGMVDGKIKLSKKDVHEACMSLCEAMVEEDSEILTLYYGEETTEDDANAIAEALSESYPDLEVLVQNGTQPLYYYIVSVE